MPKSLAVFLSGVALAAVEQRFHDEATWWQQEKTKLETALLRASER
jgi:hypothetical protein